MWSEAALPESNTEPAPAPLGVPDVTVCLATSRLVQIILVPTDTVKLSSLKFFISEFRAGVRVGVAKGVRVAVGRGMVALRTVDLRVAVGKRIFVAVTTRVGVGFEKGVRVAVGSVVLLLARTGVRVGVANGVRVTVGRGVGVGFTNGVRVAVARGVRAPPATAVRAAMGVCATSLVAPGTASLVMVGERVEGGT